MFVYDLLLSVDTYVAVLQNGSISNSYERKGIESISKDTKNTENSDNGITGISFNNRQRGFIAACYSKGNTCIWRLGSRLSQCRTGEEEWLRDFVTKMGAEISIEESDNN